MSPPRRRAWPFSRTLALALLPLTCLTVAAAAQDRDPPLDQRVEAYLAPLVEGGLFAGAVLLAATA